MSGVRIKELQSAVPLIEDNFDEMEFVVDLPEPDSTLKISGKHLKEAVGTQKHIHPLDEVDGLPGELEKKLNRAGGTISGDLRVEGHSSMKNLSIEEYLEVPEIKYNRITATGNEMWITDAGVIDDVWEDSEGIFLVTLKKSEGAAINFQYKDILRGIFFTSSADGVPTGFQLGFFEVTGVIDNRHFDCIPLNDVLPQRFMTLARQGNKSNPERQGSIYLDGLNKWLRVLDNVNSENIEQHNIKVQLGDLSQIIHPTFGQLEGYGALLENAYICGRLVQRNPTTGEDWVVGAVSVQGEQVFRYKDDIPEKTTIELVATEQGFTSADGERKWQYKSGAEWITLSDSDTLSYTLHHDSEVWGESRTIAIRYIAQDLYYDIITITKVYDGESVYQVQLFSESGNNFINGDIATILHAKVFRGTQDITDTLPDNAFSWQRISNNPEGDVVWNEQHVSVGSQISIDNDDVYRKATFNCIVTIN
ncbi:MAG: hypothetical protein SNG81_04345 [Rikenellaceae bacterium]